METVDKIKKLKENVNQIRSFFNEKLPRWDENRGRYDKVGYGFNQDDRFNACAPISIAFTSKMGVYGDSGCSTQVDLDKDIFNQHFLTYLNKNKKEIMLAIADQIEEEARKLKDKAQLELNAELDKIKEL